MSESDAVDALRLPFYSSSHPTGSHGWRNQFDLGNPDLEYDQQRLDQLRGRQRYAMECIRSLGSVVEVCPTSNRRIGGISRPEHHPVLQFLSNDVPFVVASDDPGIFDTTLAEEIDWVIQAAGLSPDPFDEIAQRSWLYRSEVLTGRELK